MSRERRITPIQRDVLNLLRATPQISFTDIAAELYIDRTTAIIAVRQLQHHKKIQLLQRGHGAIPHRYEVLA